MNIVNKGDTRQGFSVEEVFNKFIAGDYDFCRKRVTPEMLLTLPKLFLSGTWVHIVGKQNTASTVYIDHCRSHDISYDPENKVILLRKK